ncbi:MAG: PQQ-binding-like beta-propeller repeat protein [Gemmatimonadetes bacterium]|nr:PQQ-binding-like beta-propeller repeat protein [Gemmatimonadota bacterium]
MRAAVVSTLWMLGMAALTGCADRGWDPDPEPLWTSGQGSRTVVPWAADTLFHLDGRTDSLLVNPSLLRRTVAGLAVLDRVDKNVTLYSESGDRLWTAGRSGQGPGEFDNVRDLRPAEGGRLLVYDVGNGKVTTLDVFSGEVRSELRLSESVGSAESMVPIGDSVMFVTFRPENPLAVVSLVDGSTDIFEMPWDGFERLNALHRQGITAAEGARWVYLFRYGNGFFPFDGTRPMGYLGQYVEHQPFPALSVSVTSTGRSTAFADQPVCSGCSASMVHDTLFVHFGGDTQYAARVLDAYDVSTGEYLVSYELPTFFKQIEVGPGWIAGVRENPFPELLLLSR